MVAAATRTRVPQVASTAEAELVPVPAVVLHGVSWKTYQTLRWAAGNKHLRMTYDGGDLEIMSPQRKHGKIGALLGLMIFEWARRHRIKIESGGDLTMSRKDLLKGLEPDLCYWITNQPAVFGRDEWNSMKDPPPDLALEVDITRTSIPKLPIYQALKVPEVWQWRKHLKILRLNAEGTYETTLESVELPGFPVSLVEKLIDRRNINDQVTLVEKFAAAIAKRRKK